MGLSLGFVYLAMGVLIGSAVIPIALTITWKRTNKYCATLGAIIGLFVALGTWVGVAASLPEFGGQVSLASLGNNYSMLFGNVAGILTGGAIAGLGSLATKTKFDWDEMKKRIKLVDLAESEMAKLEADEVTLQKAFKFSLKGGGLMTLILIIAWPLPLFFADYVFDVGFYSLWVGISIAWVSVATFFIVGLPIIEARHGISKVLRNQKAVPESEGGGK